MATMKCNEVKELLHPYVDDELDAETAAAVRAALEDCADCRAELGEIETVRALAREALEGPVMDVDLSGVYDGVMARLSDEGALIQAHIGEEAATPASAPSDEPGLLDRMMSWLGDMLTFKQPAYSFAAAAAVALLVGGVWFYTQSGGEAPGPTPGNGPSVAQHDEPPTLGSPKDRRRGPEAPSVANANAASVESFEASVGQVIIENEEDPELPMVVWHIVDDNEGAAADL